MANPLVEQIQRKLERDREEAHERKLAEIRAGATLIEPKPAKIRWNGTAVDFADWIYQAWRENKIRAETETAAFELASAHFCQKDGRPFKPRSMQVSRKFRNDLKK